MDQILNEIKGCSVCAAHLELGPNPVLAAAPQSKIVIIGQAPGRVVHQSGIPWDDKSGDNLRRWLGMDKSTFYDPKQVALIPMGFCFPGKGKSGDLPPRTECAPLWHARLWSHLQEVKLTLLIGQYAQEYYLKGRTQPTLTETVERFENFLPEFFTLPHPSPRNNIWMKKNPWFGEKVLPELKKRVEVALGNG
ncbi:MAG: uracil-DNA glycosylase family protein [Bacteroidia bacterium]|nr:uracil-DNA glycosylase family protein [Bacteroidia bacterium]